MRSTQANATSEMTSVDRKRPALRPAAGAVAAALKQLPQIAGGDSEAGTMPKQVAAKTEMSKVHSSADASTRMLLRSGSAMED